MIQLLLLWMFFLLGCAKRADMAWDPSPSTAYGPGGTEELARSDASPPPPPKRVASPADIAAAPDASSPPPTPSPAPSPARMVHYDGYAELRADRPDEVVATVSARAIAAGGFVEAQAGSHLTVRVPVARFEAEFAEVLKLGDVVRKAVSAEDVTDAFSAVDLRLAASRATRDRLMVLLAQAKEEKDKLALLAELQRVEEEIDRLDAQLRLLSTLASLSRITVDVTSRRPERVASAEAEIAGLVWIRNLSPFVSTLTHQGRAIRLPLPEGMVALDERRRFVAESADGVVLRTSRIRNEPQGEASFWVSAMEARLAESFGGAEPVTLGAYEGLAFRDLDPAGYRYEVAVRVDGAWLEIVEVYYPGPAQVERYGAALKSALKEGNG